jgi:Uncharacterized protein conserved in bacteria
MKKLALIVLFTMLALCLTNIHALGANTQSSPTNTSEFEVDYSKLTGSQSEMNDAAYKEFKRADDKLNGIYRQILVEYKKNQLFLAKLTEAEKAWLKFRDAHLEALYPEEDKQSHYGSSFLMGFNLEKARLTWERVKQLNEWLNPVEDAVGLGSRGQTEP